MRTRIITAVVSLAVAAGATSAQPPTAPPPRPVPVPKIDNLTFRYTGPAVRTATVFEQPEVTITTVGGRVEVRWSAGGVTYTASARTAVIRGRYLVLRGPAEELTSLRCSNGTRVEGVGITHNFETGGFQVEGSAGGRVSTRPRP